MKRATFQFVIASVLAQRGINPRVRPVAIKAMTPLARDIRRELDRLRPAVEELDACFESVLAEVLDKTMTAAGQQMAIHQLAVGFRSTPAPIPTFAT